MFVGVPHAFEGKSFDQEQFGPLACSALEWTSSNAADPFPRTVCNPLVTFTTPGVRTITLRGVDPDGAVGTAVRSVSVIHQPSDSPPTVTIESPTNHAFLQPNTQITMRANATDSNGAPLSYQWVLVRPNGATTVIGTTSGASGADTTLLWTPKDHVPAGCGSRVVKIRVDAANLSGQMGSATVEVEVEVEVFFPPC